MTREEETRLLYLASEVAGVKGSVERMAMQLGVLKAFLKAEHLEPDEIVTRCKYFLAEFEARERDGEGDENGGMD